MAISQLTPAAIRNAIGLLKLASQLNIPIDIDFYKELTRLYKIRENPLFVMSTRKLIKSLLGSINIFMLN